MHVCEEFREKIADRIIGREDIQDVELTRELLVCSSCADFYAESRDLMEAISEVHFDIPEEHWDAMADRLHSRIVADRPVQNRVSWFDRLGLSGLRLQGYATAMACAAAILVVTFGIYRLPATPPEHLAQKTEQSRLAVSTPPIAVVTSSVPLDPVTVDFLEQSELLLRRVMKLQPTSVDDLADARETAGRQLVALDQRKEAASDVLPVVNMMDKYEMILREIRNLKGQAAADDITDIQNRIEKNGLISDMQAFQPKVVAADADRNE